VTEPWLTIVGLGEEEGGGIDPQAWPLIRDAELLVGGVRHLGVVPAAASKAERMVWAQPFAASIEAILARRGRPVVVLASGDPMEWGVGATLARHLSAREMTILPHPGAISLAAARLAWPLHAVRRVTLHGRPIDRLALFLQPGTRLLALSRDGETPIEAARWLDAQGWGASEITVLERLGGPHERVITATAASFPREAFADLNTLAITFHPTAAARIVPRLAGLADDHFENDGQLTKRDVRAATLAKLAPCAGEMLWDIGAGSGSVAIEWLRADDNMAAVAIERDPVRAARIARNASALGVPELQIVVGEAPGALAELPVPDAIFIGGGLSETMVSRCWAALPPGGRLVANAVSVEGEAVLLWAYRRLGGDLARIAVSHVRPLADHHVWRAAMPVCQFSVGKPR
jgi:precorrin-6Y C5,15-methyltransferase (decarboxylating)